MTALLVGALCHGRAQAAGLSLSVPDGYRVVDARSCTVQVCQDLGATNAYDYATRTVYLLPNQRAGTLEHEQAHAHQHETVLRELGHEPTTPANDEWYATSEGQRWLTATRDLPWPTTGQWALYTGKYAAYATPSEDFAVSVSAVLAGLPIDPARAAAVQAVLQ